MSIIVLLFMCLSLPHDPHLISLVSLCLFGWLLWSFSTGDGHNAIIVVWFPPFIGCLLHSILACMPLPASRLIVVLHALFVWPLLARALCLEAISQLAIVHSLVEGHSGGCDQDGGWIRPTKAATSWGNCTFYNTCFFTLCRPFLQGSVKKNL